SSSCFMGDRYQGYARDARIFVKASYPIHPRNAVPFFIRVIRVIRGYFPFGLGFATLCNRWLVQSPPAAFPRCVLCVLCVRLTTARSSSLPRNFFIRVIRVIRG